MKKMLRKMIAMMSAMMIILGCMITLVNKESVTVGAAAENDSANEYAELIEEMAVKFNSAREELGLDPLYVVPYLSEISQVRADEQLMQYAHYRPDGTFFDSVIDVEKVDYKKSGEILARGSDDVNTIFEAWKKSPGHWANITKPEFTHVGIGLVYGMDSEGRETWYWAAIFIGMWEKTDVLEGQRMPELVSVPVVPVCIGDINGDASVDAFDLILLIRIADGTDDFNEAQFAAADVLADGEINQMDILALRKYILGEYDTLPVTMEMIAG